MPHAHPSPPPLIAADATAAERARARARLRNICDLLGLPYLCPHAMCRRTRRCKGSPETCIPARTPKVPAPARRWVRGLIEARENGLDFEEALEEVAEWQEAHTIWLAGLQAKTS